MANDDENIVLMVVGVILVLIIIAYFVYPVYFDKYVLMNIPEYRRLSDVLDTSKKSLDEAKTTIAKYKGELDKLSKLGGTEAEMLASGRKKIELEKRIESYKRELKQFTGVVATLKNQLKESTGDAKECSKLQAAATMRMKETNDLLITEFVLDDKPLARRLQATRDSLLTLLTTSKDLVCANKGMALVMLAQGADKMRKRSNETNRLCDFKTSAEESPGINRARRGIRNELFNQKACKKHVFRTNEHGSRVGTCSEYGLTPRDFGPLRHNLVSVFDDLESTISYVLQNKFCSKDLTFRVDEFEKFVSKFINGLCESEDWKKVTGKQLDYILNKPATYL
jgi:hypothetical protein